jgi:hypothetical protein
MKFKKKDVWENKNVYFALAYLPEDICLDEKFAV